jgi:hypothetical protein
MPMLERLKDAVNGNPTLLRRGRTCTARLLVEMGEESYIVDIREGRVEAVTKGPFTGPSWTFALRASRQDWDEFFKPVPKPGYQDIFGLAKRKLMRIEGNLHPLMAHLLYFKEALASLRQEARA